MVNNISSSIESVQTRALDSLIDIEDELTEMCLDSYLSSVSEIFVEFLNTKDVKKLDTSFSEYLDNFNFKDTCYNYFQNLQTGDAFSELREVKLNEDMIENVEFYLNIGLISYKNFKFPIFYLPFELTLLENKTELNFNPNLFINKKAIDFVLEEIAKKYDKKQRSIVEDRVIFLNENENILDKTNDFLLKLQNTLELNEIINFESSLVNQTKSSDVTISTSLTIQSDDAADNVVALASDKLKLLGGLNITSSNSADDVTFAMDTTLTGMTAGTFSGQVQAGTLTDGTASISSGSATGLVNVTASGIVSFGTLTDSGESIAITKFVDEADGIGSNDNDTTIPTSAAVVDYVENNGGDGLTLRASFTANSSDSTFDIGTVPNVSGRTYYASRVILNVTTLLSGGSVDCMLVKDNAGAGNTLAAATTNDIAVGTYVVDLPFASSLTKNAAVEVAFVQADGTTAATPTGGVVTGVVEYKYV